MASITAKRIIRGSVGLAFAFVYGLWTMLATGGGHGNFIWFYLFMTAGFFGFYYPTMAAFSADLRPKVLKVIFGALLAFHLVLSAILIVAWIFALTGETLDDFDKTLKSVGFWGLIFCGGAHFLPNGVFTFQLFKAVAWNSSPDDEEVVGLGIS